MDAGTDNTGESAKLTEDSSLGGKDDYALEFPGDASNKETSHEAYVRHYYESKNYKVKSVSIQEESDRDRYEVVVEVDGPYGECEFTHRVSFEKLENDAWYEDDWDPDESAYYPNADSFLGKWYYKGEAADISIMIHKLDLSAEASQLWQHRGISRDFGVPKTLIL